MTEFSTDEAILVLLREQARTSYELAAAIGMPQRSIRRRLRRLIKDGYAFSPERGLYRITATGVRAMEPVR